MTSYEFFAALQDFSLLDVVTCFIEEFKNGRPGARKIILRDEPMRYRGTKQQRAFYAALCDFYCNWYHLPIPPWLDKKEYILDEPWYPYGDGFDISRTPIEFKKRNIFIRENDVIQY